MEFLLANLVKNTFCLSRNMSYQLSKIYKYFLLSIILKEETNVNNKSCDEQKCYYSNKLGKLLETYIKESRFDILSNTFLQPYFYFQY